MKKTFSLFLAALACLPTIAGTKPLEFFEDFDSTEAMAIPQDWKSTGDSPFSVYPAAWLSMAAQSGDNFMVALSSTTVSNQVLYTPMLSLAGGKKCTVSFSFIAPGGQPSSVKKLGLIVKAGTSQTPEAQTIEVGTVDRNPYADWTDFSFDFTPPEDGEYCISFWLSQGTSTLTQMGNAGIEDVEIMGESPDGNGPDIVLEPDPENNAEAVELPYIEDFEGENYDGTSYVPNKWLTTGSNPFITANHSKIKAISGDYYLITLSSSEVRDERLYTPFFVLTAGKEYTASYYIYHPGQIYDDNINTTTINFTVGTQQDKDFHKSLSKHEGNNNGWERCEVKFTPEVTGAYCFSFALSSQSGYAGAVCIEDFSLTAPGLTPSPKARFAVNHNYDLQTANIAAFPNQQIELVNLSQYGESYEWSTDSENAVIAEPTSKNTTISFSASGSYVVTLKVTNSRTSRTTSKTLNVEYFDNSEPERQVSLQTNAPDDKIYSRGMVPSYNNNDVDFITGPNCYYRQYAERISFPTDTKLYVDQIVGWCTNLNYKYIGNSRDDQLNTLFSVSLFGETDGKLDENKIIVSYVSTMQDILGSDGVGAGYGNVFTITLPAPVVVEGPCYLTYAVADNFDLTATDTHIGPSYMGMLAIKHASEVTTLYAKPVAVPETSVAKVDEWCTIDRIDPTMKGFGLMSNIWAKYYPEVDDPDDPHGSIAIASDGSIVFDVRVEDCNIIVSGTKDGEKVRLYNVNGILVSESTGREGSTIIDASSVSSGFYIIKTDTGSKKITI